ncbi:MAG: hypothetical protein EOP05_11940 [Proteobacteria bacterium]|nr:MAG: hypothetical protein EOP05_11940 [Pseudomonadota bacterium]
MSLSKNLKAISGLLVLVLAAPAISLAQGTPTASPVNAETPTPAPTPVSTPKPTPTPKPVATPKLSSIQQDLQTNCARHFPGKIQGDLRNACSAATAPIVSSEKGLAQTKCRLAYGEEPRAVMSCLIGVSISDDLSAKRDDYKNKLQLCAEQYPQHTEIDAFLQESCLTGIHLPDLMPALAAQPFETCAQLSSERSFIGPCAVGLSLASDLGKNAAPNQQNKLCEQFFDHKRFHLTYRACLNARSVAVEGSPKVSEVIGACSNIVSDPGNDNERAACLIGSNIHRSLEKKEDIASRFAKCGVNKVSYQDRDVLACLTAASLIDLVGKPSAEAGCKDVFKTIKGGSRGDCLNSLSQTF